MTDTDTIKLKEHDGLSREGSKPDVTPIPKSPFVTTTDVINQLNKQLSNLSSEYDDNGNNNGNGGDSSTLFQKEPRFELQKRLPDGSAIPATQDDTAAADFKTKLEQSAKYVSQLESSKDRRYWAEQQRQTGNVFFQSGDYKGALDIYLTCLVVKENSLDFVRDTFLPILNNLAQCTLQLGMHKKTIVFCEMALDEVEKVEAVERNPPVDCIALCKIYFKLAKALRLTGNYEEARRSLDSSLGCMIEKGKELSISSPTTSNDNNGDDNDDDDDDGDHNDNKISILPYQKAIQKEYRYLDIAEKEARKNRAKQKRAMQLVLSPSTSSSSNHRDDNKKKSPSLYENQSNPREYSKLRARKKGTSSSSSSSSTFNGKDDSKSNTSDLENISYSQYYWSMVARVANYLLTILGDEDTANADERRQNDQSGTKSRTTSYDKEIKRENKRL
ncbi:hypothetical protein FRACYDRAFT_182176 [Fragilariopsis cylindrus CCMP1102]|uniref:TPR-like protein n=1 Tax=Fragilariopsis cylindrus CCMP1102 TaxID=635003 RepID=A0A1E7FPS4_9STRA|nr:hypothetical protein FRACYDRAFT_182176 [Fragilariopsis cylindrus CCMP1102]|eukprot:OEU19803.1 hypothetical protein FRACYDRAFT_182176 [Fragilariopsis cylindrus CCMP1102]